MRGRTVDIRPRIYGIEWHGDKLVFTLCCGEKNLRPDLMCSYLKELYGGEAQGHFKDGQLRRQRILIRFFAL